MDIFFFKQKTAYELRISDGSSDVCSSDLDPVALHLDDLLRPEPLELVQIIQQAVGVVGDLEVPLRQLLLDHLVAAALAVAVDHLLVGEHGLVEGAPVDRALLAVGQTPLVELEEQPLVPPVVLRIARVAQPAPIERSEERRGGKEWVNN